MVCGEKAGKHSYYGGQVPYHLFFSPKQFFSSGATCVRLALLDLDPKPEATKLTEMNLKA
jgi:hypothetical protein